MPADWVSKEAKVGTEVLSRACLTIADSGIRSMVYHWCAAAVVQHCPLLSWLAPTLALAGTGTLWTASQPCSKGFSLAYALMRTGGTPGIFQETLCGHTRCSAGTCAKLPCAPPPKSIQRTAEFEPNMRFWILQTTCTCAMGICTHNTCNTL